MIVVGMHERTILPEIGKDY